MDASTHKDRTGCSIGKTKKVNLLQFPQNCKTFFKDNNKMDFSSLWSKPPMEIFISKVGYFDEMLHNLMEFLGANGQFYEQAADGQM